MVGAEASALDRDTIPAGRPVLVAAEQDIVDVVACLASRESRFAHSKGRSHLQARSRAKLIFALSKERVPKKWSSTSQMPPCVVQYTGPELGAGMEAIVMKAWVSRPRPRSRGTCGGQAI